MLYYAHVLRHVKAHADLARSRLSNSPTRKLTPPLRTADPAEADAPVASTAPKELGKPRSFKMPAKRDMRKVGSFKGEVDYPDEMDDDFSGDRQSLAVGIDNPLSKSGRMSTNPMAGVSSMQLDGVSAANTLRLLHPHHRKPPSPPTCHHTRRLKRQLELRHV